MKKLFTILFLILIINGCGKGDDPVIEDPVDTATYTSGTISIEAVVGLDNSSLTVQSIDGSADVNDDGSFEVNQEPTDGEEMPLLFLKDGEIIFGYFEKSDTDDSISIDDMLLFYLSIHPEIVRQEMRKSDILSKIKADSNYEELKNLVVSSLDSNISPFKNEAFVSLLNTSGYSIGKEVRGYKQSKTTSPDIFKYSYARDGTITWPTKFPIFATVGMEIVDATSGMKISGPHLLEKSGLVASPGSLLEWFYDKANFDIEDTRESFKLTSEGQYDIKFSNGADDFGSEELESRVDLINRFNLGVDLFSFVMPFGVERFLGKKECRDALINLMKNLNLVPVKLVIGNKLSLDKEIKNLAKDLYAAAVPCIPEVKGVYLSELEKTVLKYFNLVEEGASLTLFIRDYIATDVKGWETRNYYDGVSFGELKLTNLTGVEYIISDGSTEFSGAKDSEHNFKIQIEEKTFDYLINSDLNWPANYSTEPKNELALGIPFSLTKTNEGDATVKEVSNLIETRVDGTQMAETAVDGTLSSTFIMGDNDSEFKIEPSFKNSGIAFETIYLKSVDSIAIYEANMVGDWELFQSNQNYFNMELSAEGFYGAGLENGKMTQDIDVYGSYTSLFHWSVIKIDGGYYFSRSGISATFQRLSYPVSRFESYGDYERTQVVGVYTKK
jgi:hypothetical protein